MTSLNGSSVNGNCPQECVGIIRDTIICNCNCTTVPDQNKTGVLIDGVIPTINTNQRGWARQLLTVRTGGQRYIISFRFGSSVMLRVLELYVFHCPSWNIGTDTISIYNTVIFPSSIRVFNSAGNVTLTSDMENCDSIIRVYITLQMTLNTSNYFIEFTNSNGMPVQHIYIGEVRFSDQPTPNQEEMNTTTYTHSITTSSTIFTANVPQPTEIIIQPSATEPTSTKSYMISPQSNMTLEATNVISKTLLSMR